jgi:hypothetical protein
MAPEEANDRVIAIREAMENIKPGSTRDDESLILSQCEGFHYYPHGDTGGYVYDIGACADVQGRWLVVEFSWNPNIGAISAGGASIPDDEMPEQTARRLLRC